MNVDNLFMFLIVNYKLSIRKGVYLFICALINDVFSISDYIASKCRVIHGQQTQWNMEESGSGDAWNTLPRRNDGNSQNFS